MPDHAKKLGELTEMMKFEASALDRKFGHEVMASLRYKQAAAILAALGPVVEAMGSGLAEYRAFHEIAGPESHLIEIAVDDIEALLAAVEKLR